MKFNEEFEEAVRRGLEALEAEIVPGMSVVIKVNGQPAAVFVLCTRLDERHGIGIQEDYYQRLERLPRRN